jgi:hypothetical protein
MQYERKNFPPIKK